MTSRDVLVTTLGASMTLTSLLCAGELIMYALAAIQGRVA
jgi:hypothetical protein